MMGGCVNIDLVCHPNVPLCEGLRIYMGVMCLVFTNKVSSGNQLLAYIHIKYP